MTASGDYFAAHLDDIVADLQRQVELESPSQDPESCRRCSADLADLFVRYTGAEVAWHAQAEGAGHFTAQVGTGSRAFLLLGHIDTVWPVSTLHSMPFQIEGNVIRGPGVYDMKCGNIQALWALRYLVERGLPADKTFTFLATSDEEVGSPTSRALIESLAAKSEAVFVFEPSGGSNGDIKLRRKGVGNYHMTVHGRSSHAGADFEKGRSAIQELAHQVLDLARVTDLEAGTTLNVGVVHGGTATNVVASLAGAEIDLRVWTASEARRAERVIFTRPTFVEGTQVQVTGSINRPPMEESSTARQLYERARTLGQDEGLNIGLMASGGGSDGNFTAALGVPTLDGLGAVGADPHAVTERVSLSAIAPRTAWLALLFSDL